MGAGCEDPTFWGAATGGSSFASFLFGCKAHLTVMDRCTLMVNYSSVVHEQSFFTCCRFINVILRFLCAYNMFVHLIQYSQCCIIYFSIISSMKAFSAFLSAQCLIFVDFFVVVALTLIKKHYRGKGSCVVQISVFLLCIYFMLEALPWYAYICFLSFYVSKKIQQRTDGLNRGAAVATTHVRADSLRSHFLSLLFVSLHWM